METVGNCQKFSAGSFNLLAHDNKFRVQSLNRACPSNGVVISHDYTVDTFASTGIYQAFGGSKRIF